jgi:predicted dehydrogenase
MAPIRIAIVGLSASAKTSWAAAAHLPYLLSPRGQSHYQIVALLNSSTKAAEAAKTAFNLPASVKAYGDPDALAADPDVDLVVVNTRVDVHLPVARPSLRAGKPLFVEWPLVSNLSEAESLLADVPAAVLSKSIIGLQGRVMPLTLRLQSLLSASTIGKVLHSSVTAYAHITPRDALPPSLTYFADRAIGGNLVSISYGHIIDYIHTALSPWKTAHTQTQLQRPSLAVLDTDDTITSNVPDLILTTGTLAPSATVADGATLSVSLATGPPFPGTPGFTWLITGTTGSLRITAQGPYLFSGLSCDAPVTFAHHDFASGAVRDVEWDEWPAWQVQEGLGLMARSTAVVYERYAEWVEGGMGDVDAGKEWPRLEDGVALLRELEGVWEAHDRV